MISSNTKTDKLFPLDLGNLFKWILLELKNDRLFGIHKELFFTPAPKDPFRTRKNDQILETPFGVAAGPHSQMAQNIISAWLTGSRYIELKTIQYLDEIEVLKPCIDMTDEGYNCEWSQELKIPESFDQYLNAWIIIHYLRRKFNFEGDSGFIFNMSVGYNYDGILKENVQWFLSKMMNAKEEIQNKVDAHKKTYPEFNDILIPNRICDSITISTMHGCPPDEIKKIAKYFIEEKKLHTTLKLNPTLLGAELIKEVLNEKLGHEIQISDKSFDHDLKFEESLRIIKSLRKAAEENGVEFTIKLTNTLECQNRSNLFSETEKSIYLSGKPLHPLGVLLALRLQDKFNRELDISFSSGIDCFNILDVLSCGIKPITVCSDLLKPGGYTRQIQYIENLKESFKNNRCESIDELIVKISGNTNSHPKHASFENLRKYSERILNNNLYKKNFLSVTSIKTNRSLGYFDCIKAPCIETCPDNQNVPEYMHLASKGDISKAYETIVNTNPFPYLSGTICDHKCETKCTRMNYDNPLLIRDVKRFISEHNTSEKSFFPIKNNDFTVAIIGAGPSGLSAAYFLAKYGFNVTVYESIEHAGGMIAKVIPEFRLDQNIFQNDFEIIKSLNILFEFNTIVDFNNTNDNKFSIDLNSSKKKIINFDKIISSFDYIYISIGAQKSKNLGIKGEDSVGVIDALEFLENVKRKIPFDFGKNTAIIGGGNTAIDSARTAIRLSKDIEKVTLIYRRTKKEMPADKNEIQLMISEGVEILEMTSPIEVLSENGQVRGCKCVKMKFDGFDNSRRPKSIVIENSEFEIQCDTIILAIGQEVENDISKFIINSNNVNDSLTNRIYVGGDALRGASTLINAIADGRKVTESIINRTIENPVSSKANKVNSSINDNNAENIKKYSSPFEHQVKASRRVFSEHILKDSNNLSNIHPIKDINALKIEAERCLYCDEICDVCVMVCPNRANISYIAPKINYKMIKVSKIDSDKYSEIPDKDFSITQQFQILNIFDFCNECGNCASFCPTKGDPFKDKPRFCLYEKSFLSADIGYYISKSENIILIQSKNGKNIEKLFLKDNTFYYNTDFVSSSHEMITFKTLNIEIKKKGNFEINFRNAATMSIFLLSLQDFYLFR